MVSTVVVVVEVVVLMLMVVVSKCIDHLAKARGSV